MPGSQCRNCAPIASRRSWHRSGQHAGRSDGENQFAIADRAGDIRGVLVRPPDHARLCHVALAVGPNRHQFLGGVGRHHQSAGENRGGHDLVVQTICAPEFRAVLGGISHHPGNRERNDLRFAGGLNDNGRGPGTPDFARALPHDLSRLPVKGIQHGLAILFRALVQLEEEPVPPGRQRSGVTIHV